MDRGDKSALLKVVCFQIINGFFSILGIGAVLPFVYLLVNPEETMDFPLFQGMSYSLVLTVSLLGLILAFAAKNGIAYLVLKKQASTLYHIGAKVMKKFFHNVIHAPYKWHLDKNTPTIIRDINNESWNLSVNVFNNAFNHFNIIIM